MANKKEGNTIRLTYTDIRNQHYRNINLMDPNGNPLTDTNIDNDFNLNLGQRYQLLLAKLANYRTVNEYTFQTGMQAMDITASSTATISTITSSGTTATVTASAAHGFSTNDIVAISGVSPSGYNGSFSVTVSSSTVFTYTLPASLSGVSGTTSQYYPLPAGEVTIEGMYITIGSVNYPLRIINTRWNWEQLNAIQIQASAIPQFYFPRVTDFGIWPTPQAVYTGNISYHYRDRNLSVADYTTGTVTVTQNSMRLIGSGTTFTPAMVGRWFTVTSNTVPGQGFWYQVTTYIDATHVFINQPWTQATASGASYRIGESPDIPEEGHSILAWGTASDYYGGMRKDADNAAYYNNLFWTGDPTNKNRTQGDSQIDGGLIGLIDRYSDRDDRHLIKRRPKLNPLIYKVWATSLS